MLLAYPFRVLVPRRAAPEVAVSTAVALLVVAGAADLVPTPVVIALSGGAGATLAGVRLSRLASRRPSDPASTEPSWRTAALLLDAAVVVAGCVAAALPLVDAGHRAAALLGSLTVAVLSVVGLRRRPVRPPRPARLRGLVEATGPTVGLTLAGWLLLPSDTLPAPARLVAALALGGLGMAALSVFTGAVRRSGDAICRGGVLLTLIGLALLTILPPAPTGRVALLAVPPLVLGMLLTALGALSAVATAGAQPATGTPAATPPAATWPRVVLPASVLLLAAGLHVGSGRTPDRTSVLLALAAVPPLVLRELLRGGDAGVPERHAAHRRRADRAVRRRRAARPPRSDATSVSPPSGQSPDAAAWPPGVGGTTAPGGDGLWSSGVGAPTGVDAAWPDAGVAWSTFDHRSGSVGDRAALLDALAAIGDVPVPAGALLLVELHGADGLGPVAREDVLAEAVLRSRAIVGSDDLVTGCTGTGFAVVTGVGPVLAYALGIRLLTALTSPYELAGSVLRVQASIGLAEVSGAGPADVLRQAELARRRAVQLGRDRVEWYDAFLEEQLVRRLDLERELPGAVARGELDLVYQPVLDLTDRQPVGAEALLRWRSPVLGTVLPSELLPVAEDLDLVGEFEWWVLDRACRQLAAWSAGPRELWMAVNVTVRELTTPDFVQRTAAVLAAYGVAPERLVVEVAEPRIGPDLSTVVARLAGLRSLGVRTALDDFRAEHASLAQLRRLPIDLLKVGPELVGAQPAGQPPLIDVVVNVGERLGVEIVAEELESPTQVEGARRAGCRYGQGFALARPATAERVEAYFEEFPSASR
ncbi:EAL domain-containing protein [Micromonospora lupini]|uniref:Diguanylate cyclase with EAL domain n=1 Tax=Micromonospora lupini str. Lupac 08 TaxID=1150864 RepID=I0KY07_9ACTN|nr:EAL domain-containing protein [Micromonospora lupini]CCH16454.1 Diguanylate cyclase with EAL domain [Micromonospora lupini str. Lupac 08]